MQVIQGQVRHAEPVYVELDAWLKEIGPGTQGWIDSTAGVTSDMRFIGLARWESEEAARRHGERPDQDHWWRAFTELFVDLPTTHETSDVFADVTREPEQARFVQVMQGRGTDMGRAKQLLGAHSAEWSAFRPEILGTVGCVYGDAYTVAVYFADEQAAREGEHKTPPPELAAEMDELNSLAVGIPEYFDLREPWIHSPGPRM